MKFLFLLEIGVILGNTLQSKFIRQSDVAGLGNVLLLETLDLNWVGSTEKANLGAWHQADNSLDDL